MKLHFACFVCLSKRKYSGIGKHTLLFSSPAMHIFKRRGRCEEKQEVPPFSAPFPVKAEPAASLPPCRRRTTTCRDKMALYNFKKIMVVPTAKVSFIRHRQRFKLQLFYSSCYSPLEKRRKITRLWWNSVGKENTC